MYVFPTLQKNSGNKTHHAQMDYLSMLWGLAEPVLCGGDIEESGTNQTTNITQTTSKMISI